jgi:fucose permease
VIIDKFTGVRKGALLFCFLIAVGQLLFSLGIQFKIYGLAVFGRFVFGLGGENLTVAQNNYVVRWFDGKRLALAFGLVVAFSRIGTSVNFVVSPKLANSAEGVPLTVWVAMGMCVLSFIACCLASLSDYWGEKKVEAQRQVYMNTLSAEESAYVLKLDEMAEPASDDISFKMIKRIPLTAWLLFLITAFFYIAILNFYQVASDMMQNTGKFISSDKAGLYMSVAEAGLQRKPAHSGTATAARSPRDQCAREHTFSCIRAIAIAISRFVRGPHSPRRSVRRSHPSLAIF